MLRYILPALTTVFMLTSFVADAAEFRVESKVYLGEQRSPVNESLTLFTAGKVYDLLSAPAEITILDGAQRKIVLLDPNRKLRAEIDSTELTEFVEHLRVRASRQADPTLKFAAEPKFQETFDDDGWIRFASPNMTYRVRGTRAEQGAVAQAYREFADWTARLKTRISQGATPPFPRLFVNASLERRGILPEEVELTVSEPHRPKAPPTELRSTHKFETQLYTSDRKRVDEAEQMAAKFTLVSLAEYLRPPEARR